MNSLNKIQIPESLVKLVEKEAKKSLDKAQDELANTIHAMTNGQYSRVGLDIAIQALRGAREFMTFLKDVNEIPEEEDPDDRI